MPDPAQVPGRRATPPAVRVVHPPVETVQTPQGARHRRPVTVLADRLRVRGCPPCRPARRQRNVGLHRPGLREATVVAPAQARPGRWSSAAVHVTGGAGGGGGRLVLDEVFRVRCRAGPCSIPAAAGVSTFVPPPSAVLVTSDPAARLQLVHASPPCLVLVSPTSAAHSGSEWAAQWQPRDRPSRLSSRCGSGPPRPAMWWTCSHRPEQSRACCGASHRPPERSSTARRCRG